MVGMKWNCGKSEMEKGNFETDFQGVLNYVLYCVGVAVVCVCVLVTCCVLRLLV